MQKLRKFDTKVQYLKYKVLREVARYAWEDTLEQHILDIPKSIVPGKEPTEELKKEIQKYVKAHTAPYKYPRIVEFRTELPKTISGKIIRNQL